MSRTVRIQDKPPRCDHQPSYWRDRDTGRTRCRLCDVELEEVMPGAWQVWRKKR